MSSNTAKRNALNMVPPLPPPPPPPPTTLMGQTTNQGYQPYSNPPPSPAQRYSHQPGSGVLSAMQLSKWYGMVMGLNNVYLEIGKGVTGLLGPNGAGKSTFIKLMTGQLKPSQGSVFLLGEPVWGNWKLMARVGYCPEQESFYNWMTGLEFVTALLRVGGYAKTDALDMAEVALRQMDMGDAMDRAIGGYSKGMRQRVKVAQAIAHDPDILILDEPLSGTDPVGRVKIIQAIRNLEKAGKDIIISSHVLHDVERITRNIVMINRGRVIAQGDIHSIRGLIDQHPHIIKITTDEPRRLAGILAYNDFVVTMELMRGALMVKTARPDEFYRELPKILMENNITFSELTSPDDNLDAVFKYLVE